jgi:hypothetical protein
VVPLSSDKRKAGTMPKAVDRRSGEKGRESAFFCGFCEDIGRETSLREQAREREYVKVIYQADMALEYSGRLITRRENPCHRRDFPLTLVKFFTLRSIATNAQTFPSFQLKPKQKD